MKYWACALAAVAVLVEAGCGHAPSRAVPAPTTHPPLSRTWPAPIDALTPGAVVLCSIPRPAGGRAVTAATKRAVAAAYHYTSPAGLAYVEYDHRIPYSLCGADTAANIWPEPADGIRQSTYVHNYKDELEAAIASKVRAGRMSLAQGQDVFRGDWRTAWCLYVKHAAGMC